VQVQVQQGPVIQPIAENEIDLVLRKSEIPDVKIQYNVPTVVAGPVTPGSELGQVTVMEGDQIVARSQAISPLPATLPPATLAPVADAADARSETYTIMGHSPGSSR
jgi:hypothetical protein